MRLVEWKRKKLEVVLSAARRPPRRLPSLASSRMGQERRYFFGLPWLSEIVEYTNPSQYLVASSLVSLALSSSMSGQPAINSSRFFRDDCR